MATVVPVKGSSGRFAVEKMVEFMEECGDAAMDVIVKSDQEPAILSLMKDLVELRGDSKDKRTVLEESPVKSSGSNGKVERGALTIEGHLRVLKSAFEGRLKKSVDAERRVVTFMAEYAAYLVNRLEVGKDGKTAYERSRGKRAKVLGVEFGEKLLWKTRPKDKLEKLNGKWEYGIFVGVRRRSGEVWVATKDGIEKARSVRRVPVEDRWGEDCVEWVRHVPWNRSKDDEEADGDIPEEKAVDGEERASGSGGAPEVVVVNTREKEPRKFYIKKQDADRHGFTRGCGGCSSWFRGLGRQPHTEACRRRDSDAEGSEGDECR